MARIDVQSVWKQFRTGERHDSLRDLLPAAAARLAGRSRRRAPQPFWALCDVSFDLGPGEALGIIGPNGAGKSTVLKLLTKILRPTRGAIQVQGRVGALIEVAAGFHPDLTGRENVYLQGAIMGMSRADIARRFDAIVAFSGVEAFIDTPVKRYSSGMSARLGFSIAAHLEPDILLVDEVLAVGDAAFQDQCQSRMRHLIGRGMPLVFVSHNLTAVIDLCSRALVLDHGTVVFDGAPAAAVREYQVRRCPRRSRDGAAAAAAIVIAGADVCDAQGRGTSHAATGRPLLVRIRYTAPQAVRAHFAVDIFREDGVYCAGINTRMDGRDFGSLEGDGAVDLVIPQLWLLPGSYTVSVGILDAQGVSSLDIIHHACAFTVTSELRNLGVAYLARTWRHHRAEVLEPQEELA